MNSRITPRPQLRGRIVNKPKHKLESTLPFVGNNSFGGYISGSTGGPKKQSKNAIGYAALKGSKFSGTKTAMLTYAKDLDYKISKDNHKVSLQMNSDHMHNYSAAFNHNKSGKKKPFMLTTQKNTKRRSVERDHSKKKQRSSSDGNRIVNSKRKKKEHTKSPDTAYYNKMVAAFGNIVKYPTKTLRKVVKQNGKLYNQSGALFPKKEAKKLEANKLANYYGHNNSKSNDARQKSTNIRSLPLSLMNSFEKRGKDKNIMKKKKEHSLKNSKKVPNQVFYHKGKVNVSGQHLKFSKPKSKSTMSHHSENSTQQFSSNLAFSGGNTPLSPQFYQDLSSHTTIKPKPLSQA